MNNIFTVETINFIKNEMCINPEEYISKIQLYNERIQSVFKNLGIYLIESREITDEFSIDDTYRLGAYSLLTSNGLDLSEVKNEFEIADIMIRAFSRYKRHGLLHLYTGAESDCWDPLPTITKSLYNEMEQWEQNIFDKFNNILTIYRGTSYQEYESYIFSQSWTLDKDKAGYFAFQLGEDKYIGTERVVIEAKIGKNDIFAYIEQEKECIINPNEIINGSIRLIEKKVFISLK